MSLHSHSEAREPLEKELTAIEPDDPGTAVHVGARVVRRCRLPERMP